MGQSAIEEQARSKQSQILRYKELLESLPRNDKKIIEGGEILLWLFSNGHINRKIFSVGIKELLH